MYLVHYRHERRGADRARADACGDPLIYVHTYACVSVFVLCMCITYRTKIHHIYKDPALSAQRFKNAISQLLNLY